MAEHLWRVTSPSGAEVVVVLAPPGSALDVGIGGGWTPSAGRDLLDRLLFPVALLGAVVRGVRGAWTRTGPSWRVVARPAEPVTSFRRPAWTDERYDDEAAARRRVAELRDAIAAGSWGSG